MGLLSDNNDFVSHDMSTEQVWLMFLRETDKYQMKENTLNQITSVNRNINARCKCNFNLK